MKKIEIYTSPFCPFCREAKNLLMAKNVTYREIDVSIDSKKKEEMVQRAGGKTSVPEIFVDDKLIGGCDEIYGLEKEGKLDGVLGI
jgi:glutaredoxin 3